MSIHREHPFATAAVDRDPLRRFRGRTLAPVSVWAAERGGTRAGWTVSSFLVADGDPAEVLGLLDEESGLAELVTDGPSAGDCDPTRLSVNLLGWRDATLADAFAGLAPAPGGVFRIGTWTASDWGPVLHGGPGWLGVRLAPEPPTHAGWGLLIRGTVEHVELGPWPPSGLLAHLRGRYLGVGGEESSSGRSSSDDSTSLTQ